MASIAELRQALQIAHNLGDEANAIVLAQEIARQAGHGDADPMAGMPGWQRSLVGAGAEVTDWGRGVRQAVTRPLNAVGAVSDDTMASINESDRNAAERDQRLSSDIGANVGRVTANLVPGLGIATRTVRGAAALGTALGALAPTESERGRLVNMLLTGGAGAAGQALGNKLIGWATGRGKPPPLSADELAVVDDMVRRGYNPTPAQITGSPAARSAETQLASLPGSAGDMAARRGAQRELYNRELFGTMGEAPQASVSPGASARIRENFSTKYRNSTAGVQMQMDRPLFNDLVGVLQQHERYLPPDQSRVVMEYITTIPRAFDGAEYQLWRARFGEQAQGAKGPLKDVYKGFQRALDAAFDRQAPQAAREAMQSTRGEYRNFKTLDPLIRQAEAQGTDISPLRVAGRVASEQNLSGEVADLGRIGQRIGREGPNSGTAQNQFWQRVLTGAAPFGAAGTGAGAGYYFGGSPEAAMMGGAGTLAATLLAPKVSGAAYLSRALRDATLGGARKAAQRATNPNALALALRQLGADGDLAIEAMARGGALSLPSLLSSE